MEIINNGLEEIMSALVLVNPGTQKERIYFIREVVTSSSGAWFRTDLNLSRGTPTHVICRLNYGTEQRTIRIKFFGKVVRSEPGEGFAVAFEYNC